MNANQAHPSANRYTTFLGAINETIALIHNEQGPQSLLNGFTIEEREDGSFKVSGECWGFTVSRIAHGFDRFWIIGE